MRIEKPINNCTWVTVPITNMQQECSIQSTQQSEGKDNSVHCCMLHPTTQQSKAEDNNQQCTSLGQKKAGPYHQVGHSCILNIDH